MHPSFLGRLAPSPLLHPKKVLKRSINYVVSVLPHFRGWQVYVETLLALVCTEYSVRPLTHLQNHCHSQKHSPTLPIFVT
jgi:hypothetical protein